MIAFRAMMAFLWIGSAVFAQQARGINAIEPVAFERLSNRELAFHGRRALEIAPQRWKHGETEHFILHFSESSAGTQVAVEAEFYYRIITKELEITPPPGMAKSHLFIFEAPEDWEEFARSVQLEAWTGAITVGGAIFLPRNPKYRFKGNTLGHEVAHLLIRRFIGTQMPLWLEEGYAEDVSQRGYAAFYRARGYAAKPGVRSFDGYIPLNELIRYTAYPSADRIATFYGQSRRLAWYLNGFGEKGRFVKLVQLTAAGKPFESALRDAYGQRWFSLDSLEADFKKELSK